MLTTRSSQNEEKGTLVVFPFHFNQQQDLRDSSLLKLYINLRYCQLLKFDYAVYLHNKKLMLYFIISIIITNLVQITITNKGNI